MFDFPDLGDGYSCFEADQRQWKIQNFVQPREKEVELMSFLQQNYLKLVQLFIFIRSWSANGYLVFSQNLKTFFRSKLELYDLDDEMYKTWQIQLDTILENTNYQQCSLTKNTYV